jgi:hypothetical protein
MASKSKGQKQQQAGKHNRSKDKDAIGSSSSVSPSKRARSDRVQSREQSPAKSTTSSPAKSTTSRSQGKKPAEVALVTSAAGTSQAPTLEVDMPIVEESSTTLAVVEESSTTLNTKEPSAPAQRQATEKIKDKRKRTTSSYGKEYKNKKGEDSEFDEDEDDEDDEDDENEDEDESAKEKLPPTQIAVTAKNKKGRQIKSVTPDGKKITLTYTDLPLNSTILFHTP